MDAYAAALGIREDQPPAGVPGSAPGIRIPAAEQVARDQDAAAIIQRENQAAQTRLAQLKTDPRATPDMILSAQRDIDASWAELARLQKRGATVPAAAPAANDPYADALGIRPGVAPRVTVAAGPAPQPASPNTLQPPDMKAVSSGLRGVAMNQLTGIGAQVVGGYRGLATLLSGGGLEGAINDVRDYVDKHTYTPEAGTEAAKDVNSFASEANPVTWIPRGLDAVGGKVTDITGSPALGAAVNAGGNAALMALGLRGRPATAPVEVGPTRPGVGVYRPVPLADNPTANVFTPKVNPPAAPVGANAAKASAAPAAPPVPQTPEAVQAVAEKAPSSLFPETPTSAPSGGTFTPQEQLARARVLQSVGIENARRSSLAGDGIGGSTDFQTAKLDSTAGRQMRAQLDNERNALITHADSLITETGGTHGVDSPALYARGNTILAPLDGLKQWFDSKTSALYRAADERAQGVPTSLENFSKVLGDASELTNSDRVHLQGAVNAYIKKLGMSGEDGSIAGSAQQAETIRKYLNEQWSPQNSKLVGKLKDALDEDVTSAAGQDIYAEARQVRSLRAQTLDNPNGIAKLMDSSGPEGINRAVPVEKIADSLAGMPVDQFAHVIKTLRDAPAELQPQSQAALAEIKAHFANRVQAVGSSQAGQWNAKGVTKYLQNNAARMAQLFSPEEIASFRNLNDAGHIVAKDQSYPGAAVQGHNLTAQGVMAALPTAGAAAGGYIAGPMGAAVGSAAGRMAAGAVENASTMRAVKKRTVPLSELLDTGRGQ